MATSPAYGHVSQSSARSRPGATVGAAATLGTEDVIDLSAYAGRYVKIYSLDDGALFAFQAVGDTTTLVTGATALGTPMVPDAFDAGAAGTEVVVPRKKPQLRHLATGGGGTLRIIPL